MKIKLLGLLVSLLLTTTTLFSLTGCASKSSCDMKSDKKGSCGAGKCGAEMKKDVKGSCGAGKCGSESSADKSKTK